MNIPSGFCIFYPGTHASIPTNWSRVTSVDGKFVKGTAASTNPGTTGGAATHSHSAAANHSHAMSAHTHTVTIANATGSSSDGGPEVQNSITLPHNHPNTTSGAVSGGGLSDVASTYASVSNNPPYVELIVIESNGSATGIPDNGIVMTDDASFSNNTGDWAGFYLADGNNSTTNLTNKYPKAPSTGGDGGGTGGSTTNIHSLTHTHTVATHTHAQVTVNASSSTRKGTKSTSTPDCSAYTHTHTLSLAAASVTLAAGDPSLTTTETVEPAYTKLLAVQNKSGGIKAPIVGIIGLWFGTLATIPDKCTLCDGNSSTVDMRGRYVKFCTAVGEIGNTGGANSHTHAAQDHTHTASGTHTHTGTISGHLDTYTNGNSGNAVVRAGATHGTTPDAQTPTWANGSTSASSSSNEPEYITAAFIKITQVSNNYTSTLNETVTASEVLRRSITRSISLTQNKVETILRACTRIFQETKTATSSVTFVTGYGKILNDIVTASEILLKVVTRVVSSTVTATEVLSRGIVRAVSETVSFVEMTARSATRVFSNTVSAIEELLKLQGKLFSDNISVSEVFTKVANKFKTVLDNVSLTEIFARVFDKFGDTFNWIIASFGDHKPRATTQLDTPITDTDTNKPLMSSSNEKPDGFIVEQDRPSL